MGEKWDWEGDWETRGGQKHSSWSAKAVFLHCKTIVLVEQKLCFRAIKTVLLVVFFSVLKTRKNIII